MDQRMDQRNQSRDNQDMLDQEKGHKRDRQKDKKMGQERDHMGRDWDHQDQEEGQENGAINQGAAGVEEEVEEVAEDLMDTKGLNRRFVLFCTTHLCTTVYFSGLGLNFVSILHPDKTGITIIITCM